MRSLLINSGAFAHSMEADQRGDAASAYVYTLAHTLHVLDMHVDPRASSNAM
jgi:uncharacterized protein YyaL (SSP411 family)